MTVRIGLVGSGFVSDFYLQGLHDVADWEIPVVASPALDHAQRFARKWNIAEATTDVDAVIERKDLDLIIIGAPNHCHKDLVLRCARAGKHVVCTKPLARTRPSADHARCCAGSGRLAWLRGNGSLLPGGDEGSGVYRARRHRQGVDRSFARGPRRPACGLVLEQGVERRRRSWTWAAIPSRRRAI